MRILTLIAILLTSCADESSSPHIEPGAYVVTEGAVTECCYAVASKVECLSQNTITVEPGSYSVRLDAIIGAERSFLILDGGCQLPVVLGDDGTYLNEDDIDCPGVAAPGATVTVNIAQMSLLADGDTQYLRTKTITQADGVHACYTQAVFLVERQE